MRASKSRRPESDTPIRRTTVLVADDERELADPYAIRTVDDGDYAVRPASGGEAALDRDDALVAVVLLAWQTPAPSGEEVPAAIRDRESEGDSRVVPVTAVVPDPEILEMGMNGYVPDPVDRADLRAVVERMLARSEYGQQLRTYYRLVEQYSALEAETTGAELDASDAFAGPDRRLVALEAKPEAALEESDAADVEAACRNFDEP